MKHSHSSLWMSSLVVAAILMAPAYVRSGDIPSLAALYQNETTQINRATNPVTLPWTTGGYTTVPTAQSNQNAAPVARYPQQCELPLVWNQQTSRCEFVRECAGEAIYYPSLRTCKRCPNGMEANQSQKMCVVRNYIWHGIGGVTPNVMNVLAVSPCSQFYATGNTQYPPMMFEYELKAEQTKQISLGICEKSSQYPQGVQKAYFTTSWYGVELKVPSGLPRPTVSMSVFGASSSARSVSSTVISSRSSAVSSVICPMYSPPLGNCTLICTPGMYTQNGCPVCTWRCSSASSTQSAASSNSVVSSSVASSVPSGNVGPQERDVARQRTSYWAQRQSLSYTPNQRYVAYTQLPPMPQGQISRILYWLDTVALNRVELQGPSMHYGSFSQPIISGDGRYVGIREHEWFVQSGNPQGKLWRYDVQAKTRQLIAEAPEIGSTGQEDCMSRDASAFVFITYEYAMNGGTASGNGGRGNAQVYVWRNGAITQMTQFSGIDNVPFPAYPRFRDDGGRFFTFTRIQIGAPSEIHLVDTQTKQDYKLNVGANANDNVVQLAAVQKINEILGGGAGGQASSAQAVASSQRSSAVAGIADCSPCTRQGCDYCVQFGQTCVANAQFPGKFECMGKPANGWTPCSCTATLPVKSSVASSSSAASVQTFQPCVCPNQYAPVCGTDGQTYINLCKAKCKGVSIRSFGACNTVKQKLFPTFTLPSRGVQTDATVPWTKFLPMLIVPGYALPLELQGNLLMWRMP